MIEFTDEQKMLAELKQQAFHDAALNEEKQKLIDILQARVRELEGALAESGQANIEGGWRERLDWYRQNLDGAIKEIDARKERIAALESELAAKKCPPGYAHIHKKALSAYHQWHDGLSDKAILDNHLDRIAELEAENAELRKPYNQARIVFDDGMVKGPDPVVQRIAENERLRVAWDRQWDQFFGRWDVTSDELFMELNKIQSAIGGRDRR